MSCLFPIFVCGCMGFMSTSKLYKGDNALSRKKNPTEITGKIDRPINESKRATRRS